MNVLAANPTKTAAEILRANSATFDYASMFLSSPYRERIRRLYAFCRHVDDLADKSNSVEAALLALNKLETELALGQSSDRTVSSFVALCSEAGIEPALPWTLINGAKSDLEPVAVENSGELIRYAYQVAGVVGLMMCRALDINDRRAEPHAIDLGIAMQLTNIARDVAEDARLNRRYIPGPWVQGASCHDLANPDNSLRPIVRSSILRLLKLADQYYQSGWQGLRFIPLKTRTAIAIAGRLYREIGQQIRAEGCCVWKGRTTVSKLEKTVCAVRTFPSLLVSAWVPFQPHQPDLHSALAGMVGSTPIHLKATEDAV